SPRAPESKTFNETLARVTNSYQGSLMLAQVDIDTSPQIAQAVGAQGVPFVLGLVKGQPVPLFQGTVDESEVRRFFDELIKVAVANGVSGVAEPQPGVEPQPEQEEEGSDPRFAKADEAFAAGDFQTAVSEYEALVTANPSDLEAAERLAGVKLMQRTQGAELDAARKDAADRPDDVEAQLLVADLDVSGGHVDDAFGRLLEVLKRTAGDDRDRVRERLLELFTVVGADDPRVAKARRALATALF